MEDSLENVMITVNRLHPTLYSYDAGVRTLDHSMETAIVTVLNDLLITLDSHKSVLLSLLDCLASKTLPING